MLVLIVSVPLKGSGLRADKATAGADVIVLRQLGLWEF